MKAWWTTADLTPHGFCLAWDEGLLRLHIVSDAAIAVSYYSIPLALGYFVLRRRDLAFSWVFCLFAVFILACGTTHLMDIWTLFHPDYLLQGTIKAVTAASSVMTAVLLWPLIPRALSLPSPAVLRAANDRLREEIASKEAAVAALRRETLDRERTEAMLRQSQKMEAIGQLTGGVAHDFNNLLMVIQGNLEALQLQVAALAGEKHIARALRSVQQGSTLTGQLLAFARQQPLQPVTFDLNERVETMAALLPSTLGPRVRLTLDLAADLWPGLADPNHLESALLNLAINARDAMPEGGVLKIQTANCVMDAATAGVDHETQAGDYVTIAVSDTGTGMTAEVQRNAFEPFFTTKPVGKGSGLGLSQIYGFVRQSGGYVTLNSTPGAGTTVTLYLRRAAPATVIPLGRPAVAG